MTFLRKGNRRRESGKPKLVADSDTEKPTSAEAGFSFPFIRNWLSGLSGLRRFLLSEEFVEEARVMDHRLAKVLGAGAPVVVGQ